MTTEDIGSVYKTQIPAFSENADIQSALRIYHYGQVNAPNDLASVIDNSVAGYLKGLENSKVTKTPTAITTGSLNSLTTTGYYTIATQAIATSSVTGVPTYILPSGADSGLKYAGVLEVVYQSPIIFQTYHMTDGATVNAKAWRAYFNGGWTNWKQGANDDHVHDSRYHTKYAGADKTNTAYSATEVDSALSLKATLAGPAAFSGTGASSPTAVTQAVDDNSTRLATTAYVTNQASAVADGTPTMNGTAARGTSTHWARADHVHPTDTSRADLNLSNLNSGATSTLPIGLKLSLYTGGTLSQAAVAMASAIDGKPNTLLGNKAAGTPVPAGTKRIIIARDNGSGAPDATVTPVEGDLWFW